MLPSDGSSFDWNCIAFPVLLRRIPLIPLGFHPNSGRCLAVQCLIISTIWPSILYSFFFNKNLWNSLTNYVNPSCSFMPRLCRCSPGLSILWHLDERASVPPAAGSSPILFVFQDQRVMRTLFIHSTQNQMCQGRKYSRRTELGSSSTQFLSGSLCIFIMAKGLGTETHLY